MADGGFTSEMLKLPWETQLSLASGYAAYLMSFRGIRAHHTAIDTTFSTLLFGLIAVGIYNLDYGGIALASLEAFIGACVAGLVWRIFGRTMLGVSLRQFNISWSDDDPSALASVLGDSKFPISQIGLLLEDGTWLYCEEAQKYDKLPFGPCRLGLKGDVAMYLSHIETPRGIKSECPATIDEDYGALLTYVPAEKIKRITVRHCEPPSALGGWWLAWSRFVCGGS